MKNFYSAFLLAASGFVAMPVMSETINLKGKDYTVERIIERQIGPGVTYMRLRFPDYPLNVNMTIVDLNNQYNRIETTIANESAKGTEKLVNAAKRQDAPMHRVLAASNANFWWTTEAKQEIYKGIPKSGCVRNGKMVTEYNTKSEIDFKGPTRTGVTSVSYDRVLNIDYCVPELSWTLIKKNAKKTTYTVNKGYRAKQYALYNSFYGRDREFMPYEPDASNNNKYTVLQNVTDAVEIYCTMDEGQEWKGGQDILFTVKEVKWNTNGRGKLGDYDLAIVGFGGLAPTNCLVGDKVSINYSFKFTDAGYQTVEQAIGGNALVMRHGELTEHNTNEDYNSRVYSRTGYGCSQDGKTMYSIVIDNLTDETYGKSAGCSTSVMCEIARHFGCYNMANFDAGGSAMMMIDNKVVTPSPSYDGGVPRAVYNGWMIFSTAPEDDNTLASMAFDHPVINLSAGSTFTPTMLGYNRYGALIEKNLKGFTLSCDPAIGRCDGDVFIAGTKPASGMLTATKDGVSISKNVNIEGGSGVSEVVTEMDLLRCPGVVGCGETFILNSNADSESCATMYSVNGTMCGRPVQFSDEAVLKAPSVPGIYIITVNGKNGNCSTKKILVK